MQMEWPGIGELRAEQTPCTNERTAAEKEQEKEGKKGTPRKRAGDVPLKDTIYRNTVPS